MAESVAAVKSQVLPLLLLLLLACAPAALCEPLVRCAKPELSPCYCGPTTYDRQLLYAVNCTGTALNTQRSLDVFMNLPNETEVSGWGSDFG